MEREITTPLRRWLGLPKIIRSAALYGNINEATLPLSTPKEEFLVNQTREVYQFRVI